MKLAHFKPVTMTTVAHTATTATITFFILKLKQTYFQATLCTAKHEIRNNLNMQLYYKALNNQHSSSKLLLCFNVNSIKADSDNY